MDRTGIMPALSGLLLMIAMAQFAMMKIARSRRRKSELERVQELLPRHYDALDRVNASAYLPQELKDVAGWVSSGIEDRAAAGLFASLLDRGAEHIRTPEPRGDLVALRTTHPRAMEDYDLAMSTGLLASVLIWPETARRAEALMAEVLTSRQEETAAVFRIAKEEARRPKQSGLAGAL